MVDKVSTALAANAYANTAKAADKPGAAAAQKPDFSDFLKQSVSESIGVMKAGETASAAAVTGKASLPQVVEAVTQAELTLQTVVAVRDRMISAYQEILRMPI